MVGEFASASEPKFEPRKSMMKISPFSFSSLTYGSVSGV